MSVATLPIPLTRPVSRFLRTPKGMLLVLFAGLAVLATLRTESTMVTDQLFLAIATAAVLDVAIVRLRRSVWVMPDGAILTGMIVAFVLRTQEPGYVVVLTSATAIVSKHVFRTHWSNVFNPAALALVVASFLWQPGQSWWGALPDLGVMGVVVLLLTGGFIADRINKLPMILVFLGSYFALFTVASFFGQDTATAEVFRSPDLHAALFFALFMLDDPPTSPVRTEDQVVFGLIVATVAYYLLIVQEVVYFLPAALLAGNAWESGRRLWAARWRRRGEQSA